MRSARIRCLIEEVCLFDVVVIGGGPGGYGAALYAHNFGLSVALVSDEQPGGTCLLRGCIPAKQWLEIAHVFQTVARASDFGVVTESPTVDWLAALERKNRTVEGLVKGVSGLLRQRKVEVVTGRGRLKSANQVLVEADGAEPRTLEGKNIILATGSYPRSLPGWEIDGQRVVTSDQALDWASQPQRVAIVGGGVIGCEFASMLSDLGSVVTVFEVMDQIIPGSDPDIARALQRFLNRRGVDFLLGQTLEPPEVTDQNVTLKFGDQSLEADVVLLSVGRGPKTDNIGLENTEVQLDRGFVRVDPLTMQTDQPGVYAVGDIVAGTPQLAHVGFAEAITAITHIATGQANPVEYRAIPRVTYTHPEVAEVGMTETEAKEAGIEYQVTKHAFNGVGRAIIIGQNQGTVKILSTVDGPIIGASVVGPQAGELIHELMYAVGWEALPEEAAAFIHAHPTLAEGIGETLLSAAGRGLH